MTETKEILITDGTTKPEDMPEKIWNDIQAKMAELDCGSHNQSEHECSKGAGNECSSQPEEEATGVNEFGIKTFRGVAVEPESLVYKALNNGFNQVLDLCFDEVLKAPKKVLIIGGCRQRLFAQHIALMLPMVQIHLLDPDKVQAEKAADEICCRFQFDHAPLDQTGYDNGEFDIVFAQNLPEYTDSPEPVLKEIKRILTPDMGNLFLTGINPSSYAWGKFIPGVKNYLNVQGMKPVSQLNKQWKESFESHFELGSNFAPLPFKVWMSRA